MKTFTKEIKWTAFEYNEGTTENTEVDKSATVTFKDIDRHDRDQFKLHFSIISLFNSSASNEEGEDIDVKFNTDAICNLTEKFVKDMIVIDNSFTEVNRRELLHDSISLLNLGIWLFGEKFVPFFQKSIMS